MIRRALIGLIALVLLGGATACGGDDGDGSAETDESAADAESTEGEDDENDGGDGGNGGGNLLGAGGGDFCSQISAFGQDLQSDITAPNSFLTMIEQFVDIEPPEEIADEWDVLFGSIEDGGTGAIQEMSQEEQQEFQQAAETVGTYIAENCS